MLCKVYIHLSVKSISGKLLHSTRREEGGSGLPVALVLGKGVRAPRGWEIGLQGCEITLSVANEGFPAI